VRVRSVERFEPEFLAKQADVLSGHLSANERFQAHRTGLFSDAIYHPLRDIRRDHLEPLFREPHGVNPCAAPDFDESLAWMEGIQQGPPKNLPHPDRNFISGDVRVIARCEVVNPDSTCR